MSSDFDFVGWDESHGRPYVCQFEGCKRTFHVQCALEGNYIMTEKSDTLEDIVKRDAYCYTHSMQKYNDNTFGVGQPQFGQSSFSDLWNDCHEKYEFGWARWEWPNPAVPSKGIR